MYSRRTQGHTNTKREAVKIQETYWDLGDRVDGEDNQRLEELLDRLGSNEKLILTMNRADAHETDDILQILEERGFEVMPRGGHNDEYYLEIWKRED